LAIWLLAGCTAPVRVEWATEVEINTAAFDLYRSEAPEGPFSVKVNDAPIPASTDPMAGGEYSYVDRTARVGRTYYYQLHELEIAGTVNTYGPIEVRASWLDARWTAAVAVGIASAIGVWAVVRRRSRRAAEPKLRS
jgi:hypothetical protein